MTGGFFLYTLLLAMRGYSRESVPMGPRGTERGIDAVKSAIRKGRADPDVHELVADIVTKYDPKDNEGRLRAVYNYAQSKFEFVRDPWHVEMVKEPQAILNDLNQRGTVRGDCDDATVFLGTLVESAGYPTRVSMIKSDPRRNDYSHIYLEAHDGKKWVPMDIISKKNKMGWEFPKHFGKRSDLVSRPNNGYRMRDPRLKAYERSSMKQPWSIEAWQMSGLGFTPYATWMTGEAIKATEKAKQDAKPGEPIKVPMHDYEIVQVKPTNRVVNVPPPKETAGKKRDTMIALGVLGLAAAILVMR